MTVSPDAPAPPQTGRPTAIRCRDGCGRVVASADEALAQAWHFLVIAKGWRCPDCAHALDRVNRIKEPRV